MIENEKKIQDEELNGISGGESDEERRKREENERKLHGHISKDMFGNVTFTDKTGVTGNFTADEWAKLRKNWDYTGAPEYWMETINVSELQQKLQTS